MILPFSLEFWSKSLMRLFERSSTVCALSTPVSNEPSILGKRKKRGSSAWTYCSKLQHTPCVCPVPLRSHSTNSWHAQGHRLIYPSLHLVVSWSPVLGAQSEQAVAHSTHCMLAKFLLDGVLIFLKILLQFGVPARSCHFPFERSSVDRGFQEQCSLIVSVSAALNWCSCWLLNLIALWR